MHQTYRRLIALTLCAGLITTAFSTQSEELWQVSYADTTVSSDDQAQIDDLNNQYEELEEQQKEIQAQIDAAKSEKDKYLAEKNQLNGHIDNTQAQINVLTDNITLLDNMIAENNASLRIWKRRSTRIMRSSVSGPGLPICPGTAAPSACCWVLTAFPIS